MRILYVTNKFPSRSETFIATKILGMASKGHEVLICCTSYHPEEIQQTFSGTLKIVVLNRNALLKFAMTHPAETIMYMKKKMKLSASFLVRQAADFKPDITHFVFSGLGILFLEAINLISGKRIVSCRGSAEKLMPLVHTDRSRKMSVLFDRVDAIHCVSDDMRQTILPYCTNPDKIFVQYTGINTALFIPGNRQRRNKIFTIISVGRLSLQKGFITGMHIMYKLKKEKLDFRWLIVGDGPQQTEVKYHCHFMNLADVIEFAGAKKQNEVIDLYKQADMFFLPSIYEGVCNAVIEAMCMKLPIVSSKSGGIEEVIENGVNGFIADVGDVDTMYMQIRKIMSDEVLANDMGERAYISVVNRFTKEHYLNGFEKQYLALLK